MKKLIIFCSLCLGLFLTGCTGRQDKIPAGMSEFKEIEILETGLIECGVYYMFKDTRTGMRIFYFNQSIVVLPAIKKEPVEE